MENYKVLSELQFVEGNKNASQTIQIGETDHKLLFRRKDDETQLELPGTVNMLLKAGMQLNFQPLIDKYESELLRIDEILENQKREKYKNEYAQYWAHRLKDTDIPKIDGLEHSVEEQESYVEKRIKNTFAKGRGLEVKYKGHTEHIHYRDVGRGYYSGDTNMKYQLGGPIVDYKIRSYASLKSAVNKFVELVDQKIAAQKREAEDALRAEAKKRSQLETLQNHFGEIAMETEHKQYGHTGKVRRYDIFKVVVGDKKLSIAFTNDEEVFNFAGMGKLNIEQIKKIIEIIAK